jgi:S-adenosylmethionine:tRNA ribosyltransferase-isomerase
MQLDEFDYNLPKELIAQTPVEPRDHSNLLIVDRKTKKLEDKKFFSILDEL